MAKMTAEAVAAKVLRMSEFIRDGLEGA
jgi:hypothetical protein